jgi:predicted dinucleotide-binding enzyme
MSIAQEAREIFLAIPFQQFHAMLEIPSKHKIILIEMQNPIPKPSK